MRTRLVFDLFQYGDEISLEKLKELAQVLVVAAVRADIDVLSVTTENIQEVLHA
jgi:hypothetical protein